MKTDQAECAYLDSPPEEPIEKPVGEKRKRKPAESNESLRSTDAEIKEEPKAQITDEKASSDIPKILSEEFVPVETVPERIISLAEAIKEKSADAKDKMIIVEVKEESIAENPKEEKSELSKETEATA